MDLDMIWMSLLTASFTLSHKPWQRTQASVKRILERKNLPTVSLLDHCHVQCEVLIRSLYAFKDDCSLLKGLCDMEREAIIKATVARQISLNAEIMIALCCYF